ncbi:MAG: exodeoxyribonuclease I [Gammaproteobacteria bacterium]|nr:exodeoxyribonuclease I [Gammaproteobacteria bacterium]
MANKPSLYWYDYETFGINPRQDRIAQFAGIRTDEDLNIISEPLNIYCKAADDFLPNPEACLITGITPQHTIEAGILESEFIAAINSEFSTPQTCVTGFNNIRFDDEFTRYALYRNFFDAYAREWQNGCSRWDIIDLVRVTRALRPEGIEWPLTEEGVATNRLELITRANGIAHEAAHDAMSDVYATIAVAKLIREKQPRLYEYVYGNKQKNKVSQLLNVLNPQPVLHTSGMYPGEVCNTAMVIPLAPHPTNKNGIIIYDLRYDPQPLIELDSDTIKQRLYTPRAELAEGVERIPLKTIHINKCPVVVPLSTLDDASAQRIGIDRALHQQHFDTLSKAAAGLTKKIQAIFKDSDFEPTTDPDQALYSGGFFSDSDRAHMQTIREMPVNELASLELNFKDKRLDEMLLRYRARNYPATLNQEENLAWQAYRKHRLLDENGGGSMTLDAYMNKLDELSNNSELTESKKQLLNALRDYGNRIKASLTSS